MDDNTGGMINPWKLLKPHDAFEIHKALMPHLRIVYSKTTEDTNKLEKSVALAFQTSL